MLDLLYISKSDEKYIVDTYSNIVMKNIPMENYTKEESGIKINDKVHTATGYRLQLSEKETKNIVREALTYMKDEDARSINLISSKLKLLNLPKKYTEYEYIKNQISVLLDQIDAIEATDDKFMEITVYVENGDVIQTNLKIRDGNVIKFTHDKEDKVYSIIQENPNREFEKSSNAILKYIANIQEVTFSNNLSDDKSEIITKFNAKFYNNLVIEYSSRYAMVDSIVKNTDFEDSKKIILNELEGDALKKLWTIIKDRVPKIYEEKKSMLSNQNNFDEIGGEIQ